MQEVIYCSSRNVWIDTSTFSTLSKDSGSSLCCPFPFPHAKTIFPFAHWFTSNAAHFKSVMAFRQQYGKPKSRCWALAGTNPSQEKRQEVQKETPVLLSTIAEIVDTRYGHLAFSTNYRMIPWILTVISGMGCVLRWLYSIPSAFLVLQAASLALSKWGHSSGKQIWTKTYLRVVLKLDKLWVPGQWSSAATEDIKRGKQESLEVMTREMCTSSTEVCMSCSVTSVLFAWPWPGWSYSCKCSVADKQSGISQR